MRRSNWGRAAITAAAMLLAPWAHAGFLAEGEMELAFSFAYSDLSVDGGPSATNVVLTGRFGFLLTDTHELGIVLDYADLEDFSGPRGDEIGTGAFYHFNFQAGADMNPYVGGFYTFIGGDAGDVWDTSYGLEAGVKLFPWDSGGFNFGVRWSQLTGDAPADASGIDAFAGIQLKW
jgi:hypothetical protein